MPLLRLLGREKRPTCPFCKVEIHGTDDAWSCTSCGTPHHLDCACENEECTALGCGTRVEPHLLREALARREAENAERGRLAARRLVERMERRAAENASAQKRTARIVILCATLAVAPIIGLVELAKGNTGAAAVCAVLEALFLSPVVVFWLLGRRR